MQATETESTRASKASNTFLHVFEEITASNGEFNEGMCGDREGKNWKGLILQGSGGKLTAADVILKYERLVGHSLKSITPSVGGYRMDFISHPFFSQSAIFASHDFFYACGSGRLFL